MDKKGFPYTHIIWDWNGTLLNDKWLCIDSINQLLRARNLAPIDENRYERIFRFPVRDYYEDAGFDFTVEPFEVPALEFIRMYDFRKKECTLQPGALKALETFEKLGATQYLLSASETGVLHEMTEFFNISRYFKIIKGLDNHYAHGKTDLGLELLADMHAPAGSVVMIGDTCHDQEVADRLEVPAILLTHGHFPEDRLVGCGSTLIANLDELIEIFSAI